MIAAALLGKEARGLLAGEGARMSTLRQICELVDTDPAVEAAGCPLTMYFGPHPVLLALDVRFDRTLSAGDIANAVDRIARAVRSRFPRIRHIYLEAGASRLCFAPTRTPRRQSMKAAPRLAFVGR